MLWSVGFERASEIGDLLERLKAANIPTKDISGIEAVQVLLPLRDMHCSLGHNHTHIQGYKKSLWTTVNRVCYTSFSRVNAIICKVVLSVQFVLRDAGQRKWALLSGSSLNMCVICMKSLPQ